MEETNTRQRRTEEASEGGQGPEGTVVSWWMDGRMFVERAVHAVAMFSAPTRPTTSLRWLAHTSARQTIAFEYRVGHGSKSWYLLLSFCPAFRGLALGSSAVQNAWTIHSVRSGDWNWMDKRKFIYKDWRRRAMYWDGVPRMREVWPTGRYLTLLCGRLKQGCHFCDKCI
jgi:hypothetical protein